jgi:tRNA A-37 threonylcarbamoyl transferase component Bud32
MPTVRPEAFPRHECLGEDEALRYVSSPGEERDPAIEGHLDVCEGCRMMLAEAARAMSASGQEETPAPSSPPLQEPTSLVVGETVLDRYTIVHFIARGGMGEVYEAYDAVLRETVALKTIVCTDLDQPGAIQRLMAEVRLARQVTHPSVCRIYEFGMHTPAGHAAEPIPFLTMEFLQGETVDRRLARRGRFDPADVARLIPQLTAGLGAIHEAGIIHRDIKPANMTLLPGPPERLVLMDFGLARSTKPLETSHSLTAGRVVGTVDYMAPEQVGGQTVTRAVDIYALGLVIFEMLTGRRPFASTNALATAVERLTSPPPRPSELVPELGRAWDDLVARCLAPDPARRFDRAADIMPPTDGGRARPSRPWAWRASLAVMAALLLALGLRGAFHRRDGARPGAMVRNGQNGTDDGKAITRPPLKKTDRVITASGCSGDMVRVANQFCIDRYESSAVDDLNGRALSPYYPPSPDLVGKVLADWTRRVEGGTTGLPVPLPPLPEWEQERGWRPRAVSQPGVVPQGYTTQIIAAVACAAAGKRLCTTDEWRTACRGERRTKFPYGPTYQPGVCNVSRSGHPAGLLHLDYTDGLLDPRMNTVASPTTGPLLRPTGATPTCASRWGNDAVYDMVGNLDEWSADPAGVILGGFYWRPTAEGCEATNTSHTADFFNYSLGIRCCDHLR